MSSSSGERYPLIPVTPSSDWDFTDRAATMAIEMSLIHNVLIRGLNSLWYHAPIIKKGDETAFAGYALTWAETLHHHHHGEETIIFPFLQTKFDMGKNVEQHAEFHDQVDALEEYMKKVYEKKEVYDGEKARGLVEAFGDTLVGHLNDEIPTISPERMGQLDKKELDAMMAVHTESIKALPLTTAHTMVLTHHDLKTYPNWPPIPGPVYWIIKNIAYWRYRSAYDDDGGDDISYWKFAPFSRQSEPQKYIS